MNFRRVSILFSIQIFVLLAVLQIYFNGNLQTVLASSPTNATELITNGDFSSGFGPWWATPSVNADTSSGELLAEITNGGSNPWDAIVGQHGVPIENGVAYTITFEASASSNATIKLVWQEDGGSYDFYGGGDVNLTAQTQLYTFYVTGSADNAAATFQFQMGGSGNFTVTIDNVSVLKGNGGNNGGGGGQPPQGIHLNQTGYMPSAPKIAAIQLDDAQPVTWTVELSPTLVVLSGTTTVFGYDSASGESIHHADFSALTDIGDGFVLVVGGESSHPFKIDNDIYENLRYEALSYFYHNRSGISLTMPYVQDPIWARPAGHLGVAPNQGDYDVACFTGQDTGGQWYNGCDYTLDLTGGWYDAGDHGKYVVNGGISAWTLMNLYERALHLPNADVANFADGSMSIPENANGVPDLLDEVRWQMDFMMRMQVPMTGTVEGEQLGGMVHHKMADVAWTGLPLLPHQDSLERVVYPPSTAATLNLAATAAQCARLFDAYDSVFADACLASAESAWTAALANPNKYAGNNFTGSGPYDDSDVSDEFYWAAVELYLTTGEQTYLDYLTSSGRHLETGPSMNWQQVAPLGTISLAVVPSPTTSRVTLQADAQAAITAQATTYTNLIDGQGYRLPYGGSGGSGNYEWGSNSIVVNNALIIGLAHDFQTGDSTVFLDAVTEAMNYLMGRNPMDQSYVTGYGERPLQNPHHRFWANQLDSNLPSPPPGVMSGGPNSSIQDPIAGAQLGGCAPQMCFIDHIESWSTNEITINWNAPFAWMVWFLSDYADEDPTVPAAIVLDSAEITPPPSIMPIIFTLIVFTIFGFSITISQKNRR